MLNTERVFDLRVDSLGTYPYPRLIFSFHRYLVRLRRSDPNGFTYRTNLIIRFYIKLCDKK